ncbi:hypothetical protein Tco_0721633, partial [Tanacetum coccineum]
TFNVVEGDDFQENQDAENVKEDDEANDGDTGDAAPDDEEVFEVGNIIGEIKGEIGINTFRNALRAHYLPHSGRFSGEIEAKGTLKKSFLPPKWRLLMDQIPNCCKLWSYNCQGRRSDP